MAVSSNPVSSLAAGILLLIGLPDDSRVVNMDIDWHRIADCMWNKMTIQQACKELGYDWSKVDRLLDIEKRCYLLDVSMVAGARDEYLGER